MGENENVTLKVIYRLLQTTNTDLSAKIDSVKQDCIKVNEALNKDLQEAKKQIKQLESANFDLKQKLKTIERKSIKYNLILYGLEESLDESNLDIKKNLELLFLEKLGITLNPFDIRNCYRLRNNSERDRPILIEFQSNFTRFEILRNKTKLKGTNLFIQEDLIFEDRQEKKVLVEKYKEAKAKNIPATLRGRKIVIGDKAYGYSDIKVLDDVLEPSSPPAYIITNSAPSTPTAKTLEYDPNEFILVKNPQFLTEKPNEVGIKSITAITGRKPSGSSPASRLDAKIQIPKKNPHRATKKP